MAQVEISLEKFADFSGEVGGVKIDAGLPLPDYVPAADIAVNLSRLAKWARIGRFQSLEIGMHSEEPEITPPAIGMVGSDGTATAAIATSKAREKRGKSRLEEVLAPFHPADGSISINTGHSDLNEVSLRAAGPWAELIDKALRENMRGITRDHLLGLGEVGGRWRAWIGMATLATLAKDIASLQASNNNSPLNYLAIPIFTYILFGTMNKVREGKWISELTLVPGIPIDRIALVEGLTRTTKVVKAK